MNHPFRDANRIELLESGAGYFPALLAAIDGAAREVFLETYIYDDDATAARITAALAAAARRGAAVRVLVDGFGARDMAAHLRDALVAAGVELLVYRRPLWWQPVRGLRRMHRKLAVADATVAFVGGINIIDDWNTPNEVPPRFDYAVRMRGPVVDDVAAAAWHLWTVVSFAAFRRRRRRLPGPPAPAAGTMRARLLVRDNLAHRRDIENAYLAAIGDARADILIAIAYFLPSPRVFDALRRAALRGVRVRILLQGPSDHLLLKRASEFLYRRLHAAGIEVLEYHRSFLHSKVAVIDDAWATVGSSNLDPFSLLLSREANVEVVDRGFAATLRDSLQAAIAAGATPIDPAGFRRRPVLARLVQWASYRFARAVIDALNLARKN
ncbi:MAG: cardiolipin synthase ClsB [Burkholderiales bacterium]|nr:cardiolipin synthase ClsB [Burkholderiales bacterium]